MRFMLGVDEAGRGPLAGPVSVGVVAVPEGFDVAKEFPGVADSKKLSEKKRENIFEMLEARAMAGDVRFIVAYESERAIDQEGIAVVIRRAVERGVRKLTDELGSPTSKCTGKSDFHILLDGSLHAPVEYSQETIIDGDELVPLISLASIAAKVSRDRLVVELAKTYPAYGFEKHKGYGTKAHYEALRKHGLCAIHRRSFIHLDAESK
ncbi:MAG: ribonuclease HII [Candidatus Pacebacteria bacterium]|nr:ribonuclease HII [Candidatus Paceibacterota bacterium]